MIKDVPSPCLIARGNTMPMRKLPSKKLMDVHYIMNDEIKDDKFGQDFRRPFFQVLPYIIRPSKPSYSSTVVLIPFFVHRDWIPLCNLLNSQMGALQNDTI